MINIDKALVPSMIAIIAVFLSYFIRQKFFTVKINQQQEKSFFEKIYLENKKLIIFLFVIFFCVIAYLNFQFSIYQKGFIYPHKIPSLIVNFIKWMLLFGFTTFSCFFIYTEVLRLKRFSPIVTFVMFVEIFISYSSMLSRLLILTHASIVYSFTKYWDIIKNKVVFFIFLFFLVISMFIANNYFSNHYRINYTIDVTAYEQDKENYITKREKLKKLKASDNYTKEDLLEFEVKNKQGKTSTSLFLVINRWIGIESMIAIVSTSKLNFDLFFKSLKEKKIIGTSTFYEKNFYVDHGKKVSFGEKRVLKGNTLPGIITFFFYTGNYYFLFLSMLILTLVFSFVEILCLKISNKNMIFASFISYTIAFRLSNFGYVPGDSYLYLVSIAASIMLIFILSNYKGLYL